MRRARGPTGSSAPAHRLDHYPVSVGDWTTQVAQGPHGPTAMLVRVGSACLGCSDPELSRWVPVADCPYGCSL